MDLFKGGIEAAIAFDGVPIGLMDGLLEEGRLPGRLSCGTAPQHLLFALPAPDQPPVFQHLVQDVGDGVALNLNVLSQLPCRDFLEMNRSAGLALGSISV